jgi:hypothetical protein
MRQRLARRRLRRRRSWLVTAAAAGIALVGGFAIAQLGDQGEPARYALSPTRACLSRAADVQKVPVGRGTLTYPGIEVRFAGPSAETGGDLHVWDLYFAPSVAAARASETPDSERLLRRRNVIANRVSGAGWDGRILRCFREPTTVP